MRIITEKNLQNTLFSQIQTNAIARGNCHWDGYKQWCIRGEEIEQAIKDIFADDAFLKPTIDIVRCEECTFCHYNSSNDTYKCVSMNGMNKTVARDDFCSYGERKDNERKAD